MSVDGNATTPATKRNFSEVIHQDNNYEFREQIKIITRGKRSTRRRNANSWILARKLTFDEVDHEDHEVDRPRFILRKFLYESDLSAAQARLLLPRTDVKQSSLLKLLKPAEHAAIFAEGLPVRAFDWHGREFNMLFKFVHKTNAYRLIKDWGKFLDKNKHEMRPGNQIEITWFRIARNDGSNGIRIGLHYVKKETQEQKETAAPALAGYENIKKRKPKQKNKRVKTDNTEDQLKFAVAERQIVNIDMEFPTAEELLVAEALLLLNPGKVTQDEAALC